MGLDMSSSSGAKLRFNTSHTDTKNVAFKMQYSSIL